MMKCECNHNMDRVCSTCLDNPNLFNELEKEKQDILIDWITDNLDKRKTINDKKRSYGLKHNFERSSKGFYITNGIFKGAMHEAGFKYKQGVNWTFNIK